MMKKKSMTNWALLATGGGLLWYGGIKGRGLPPLTSLGGLGLLTLGAYRMKSSLGLKVIGASVAVLAVSRFWSHRSEGRHLVGAAEHPGLGPSLAVQEAAWKSQPNAEQMYPWDQIFSQPTVAPRSQPGGARQSPSQDPRGYAPPLQDPRGYATPLPNSYDPTSTGHGGSGGNPTKTSTEVRSPTSTSTEVRSPTSTSTEVRSPTSTSTEAFTADNFTATVTGGAGAGANTTVNINFSPPKHMADDLGHTSHVGVTPPFSPHEWQQHPLPQQPQEQLYPQQEEPPYDPYGLYPPQYPPSPYLLGR